MDSSQHTWKKDCLELTKDDLPEGIQGGGGDGGNGGDGGRAMTMCILIAPVINIDSNIPLDPNAVLERPNLSYAPYLRMGQLAIYLVFASQKNEREEDDEVDIDDEFEDIEEEDLLETNDSSYNDAGV